VNYPESARLKLTSAQYDRMLHHVQGQLSEESCGLIAGLQSTALAIFPVTNSLHSPTRFRMDASEQVKALLEIERSDWELLAIYHSHLHGPAEPSVTDTKEFAYPGVTYLIIDLSHAEPKSRAFQLIAGSWVEIPITILG
jgi:proteasome lid subunit RPN8/RPN11